MHNPSTVGSCKINPFIIQLEVGLCSLCRVENSWFTCCALDKTDTSHHIPLITTQIGDTFGPNQGYFLQLQLSYGTDNCCVPDVEQMF